MVDDENMAWAWACWAWASILRRLIGRTSSVLILDHSFY